MDFSREDKALLGVGIAAVLAVVTIAVVVAGSDKKVPKKKHYGLKVGAQCSTYEFTDLTRAHETIDQLVEKTASQGTIDPFQLTTEWLHAAAAKCNAYPKQTRNPGEATLYRDVFYDVIASMRERMLLTQAGEQTYLMMVDTWAVAQGVEVTPT